MSRNSTTQRDVTFESAGGKGANQATAASLLGAEVRLIGAVGTDPDGASLRSKVAARGVDVTGVETTDAPTGEAQIYVDEHGENFIVVNGGANLAVTPALVYRHVRADEIIATGFEVNDDVIAAAAAHADAHGALFVLNPSPVRPILESMLTPRTLLVLNEHELAEVAPGASPTKEGLSAASRILKNCDIVVTRGGRGAVAFESATRILTEIPSLPVRTVDTSGCGDGFTGVLVAALAHGASLVDAAYRASAVGAFAATKKGTQSSYPTLAELEQWMRERGSDGTSS